MSVKAEGQESRRHISAMDGNPVSGRWRSRTVVPSVGGVLWQTKIRCVKNLGLAYTATWSGAACPGGEVADSDAPRFVGQAPSMDAYRMESVEGKEAGDSTMEWCWGQAGVTTRLSGCKNEGRRRKLNKGIYSGK